jgi:hypothetical protein
MLKSILWNTLCALGVVTLSWLSILIALLMTLGHHREVLCDGAHSRIYYVLPGPLYCWLTEAVE